VTTDYLTAGKRHVTDHPGQLSLAIPRCLGTMGNIESYGVSKFCTSSLIVRGTSCVFIKACYTQRLGAVIIVSCYREATAKKASVTPSTLSVASPGVTADLLIHVSASPNFAVLKY